MFHIDRQSASDHAAIEDLLDSAFGPARFKKTAQRLRDGMLPAENLAFVARDCGPWGERLVGTLTFWNVRLGPACHGLMLGPIAVHADYKAMGIGRTMILRGLQEAKAMGHKAVILVGDAPYYQRFGFTRALTRDLVLPGPVDDARFLGLELEAGSFDMAAGLVRPDGRLDPVHSLLVAA